MNQEQENPIVKSVKRKLSTKSAVTLTCILSVIGTVLLASGFFALCPWAVPEFLKGKPESTDTQVVRALQRTEEVSLLRLGITGIKSQETSGHFFSMEIPGTDRAKFIQYTFDAKLGFEGKDAHILHQEGKIFTIEIPEFKFIGYDNPEYRVIVETNGAMSFGTPQIDTAEMINEILNDKTKQSYLEENIDLLKEQAKSFYTSIILSIDPEVKLNFVFADNSDS